MINPFLLDPKSRQRAWQQVRQQIKECHSSEQQIDLALNFWKQASLENHVLDWDHCEHWPGPWELIFNNSYCTSSHSLGVAYTLLLSDSQYSDIQLRLIQDREHHVQKIVAVWKDWVLNHAHVDKKPISRLQNCYTQATWTWDGKRWNQS